MIYGNKTCVKAREGHLCHLMDVDRSRFSSARPCLSGVQDSHFKQRRETQYWDCFTSEDTRFEFLEVTLAEMKY